MQIFYNIRRCEADSVVTLRTCNKIESRCTFHERARKALIIQSVKVLGSDGRSLIKFSAPPLLVVMSIIEEPSVSFDSNQI